MQSVLSWSSIYSDFCKRFVKLLPGPFRNLDAAYSLELLISKSTRSWICEGKLVVIGPVEYSRPAYFSGN